LEVHSLVQGKLALGTSLAIKVVHTSGLPLLLLLVPSLVLPVLQDKFSALPEIAPLF
jgi:hypothetical protein